MEKTEEIILLNYIKILLRRKWILLLVIISILFAIFILNSILSPVYKATTTVLISPSGAQQSILGNIRMNPIFGGADELETHIEILKSNSIARGVAEKLPADIFKKAQEESRKKKEESLIWPFNLFYRFYLKIRNSDAPETVYYHDENMEKMEAESPSQEIIRQIRNSITIKTLKDTNMIEISCESNDPELAAEIANNMAEVFVEQSNIINRSSASEARKFIEEQLLEKEKELAAMEQELLEAKSIENGPDEELKLTRLERTVRVSEDIYLLLLEKFQEARISEVMEFRDIRVIDHALIPKEPIKPKKMSNLIVGGILGVILGVILAFFLEYIDDTIKTNEDVEHILNLPVLGIIPKDNFVSERKKIFKDVPDV